MSRNLRDYTRTITINLNTMKKKKNRSIDNRFNQWLAGFIDGDGYFAYSKKGYVALEITCELRDKRC